MQRLMAILVLVGGCNGTALIMDVDGDSQHIDLTGKADMLPISQPDLIDTQKPDLTDPSPDLSKPDLVVVSQPDLDGPDLLILPDLLQLADTLPLPPADLLQLPDLSCSNCSTSNPCMTATCINGTCMILPISDGNTCSTGTGKCHGGSCCTGCWNGTCQPGNTTSFCGVGGNACSICSTNLTCHEAACASGGQCVVTPVVDGYSCPDGLCHGGSCCTGCLDNNGVCHPGTDLSACGNSGSSCSPCTSINPCLTPSCISTGFCQLDNAAKLTPCGNGMVCDGNGSCVASCGIPGMPCCTNHVCNTGSYCDGVLSCGLGSGACVACGGQGQPCCCPWGTSCTGSFAKCDIGFTCSTSMTNGCNGRCQ